MNRKRLLWLGHFVPWPPAGGALQRSYHLLRLAAARYDVHLVTLNQIPRLPTPEALNEARSALAPLLRDQEVFTLPFKGSAWEKASLALRAHWLGEAYDVTWLRHSGMLAHVKRLDPSHYDLVHVDTGGLLPYAKQFRGLPIVLNHHNIESQMMERRSAGAGNPLLRLALRSQARRLKSLELDAGKLAVRHMVVSDLDRDRLLRIIPDAAVDVVPNGVDTDYFRPPPGRAPTPRSLVFVGRLSAYTNADAALYLLREIMPLLPEFTLTLVGSDPSDAIRQAASRVGATVTGFLPDVRPAMTEAEIYVCPIRDGGGTRLKILDALSMGKPLVATELAVEGIGLTPGRDYLTAQAPAQFAEAIRRLSADSRLRQVIAESGRNFVKAHFMWDAIGTALHESYDKAVCHQT